MTEKDYGNSIISNKLVAGKLGMSVYIIVHIYIIYMTINLLFYVERPILYSYLCRKAVWKWFLRSLSFYTHTNIETNKNALNACSKSVYIFESPMLLILISPIPGRPRTGGGGSNNSFLTTCQ